MWGTYRALFAVFSALTLLSLIWTGVREVTPEWKTYQREYYDLLEQKRQAAGDTNFRSPPLEIDQIWMPSLGKTDRCMTCHMGVANADFANEKQPFKTHPGKYLEWHPPAKFGCTSCHLGQGLALLMILMFPANISAARRRLRLGGRAATPLAARTPMQVVFVGAALAVALG